MHSMKLNLQDFNHIHDRIESLTSDLNKTKLEVKSYHDITKREQTLRESIEGQLQHHQSQYQEYRKKVTDEMAQLYARIRESEESYEKVKSENEELRQKNIMLTKPNELILKRVEDIEKETNVMQDKLFDGELVTHGNNQTTDQKLVALQQQQQRQLDALEFSPHDKTNKVFRKIKPVGDTIIFGDSNTLGLDRKRLAMSIGSLSGATLDSAIAYLENDPTPSEADKRVIYHVGTNNISIDSTEEIKAKLDTLKDKTTEKYPSATIGFCEIPTIPPNADSKSS